MNTRILSKMREQDTIDNLTTFSESLDPKEPDTARRIRQAILEYLHRAGGGHFGSCSSCVEIILALFSSRQLECRDGRGDRLLLSKGHASMTLYAALSLTSSKSLPLDSIGSFASPLQGHPDFRRCDSIDFSFGSLGQGLAVGLGLAIGLQSEGIHIWVVLGDGECQEGMIWEAAMLAARYRVYNLHVIVDANDEQECGWAHDPNIEQSPVPGDAEKWKAFGWQTYEANGHDIKVMSQWIQDSVNNDTDMPSVMLARTRKTLTEFAVLPRFRNHHTQLTEAEYSLIANVLRVEK